MMKYFENYDIQGMVQKMRNMSLFRNGNKSHAINEQYHLMVAIVIVDVLCNTQCNETRCGNYC